MVAPRKRVRVITEMDLDPIPGSFSTAESVHQNMDAMLNDFIPHYHPEVITVIPVEKEQSAGDNQ